MIALLRSLSSSLFITISLFSFSPMPANALAPCPKGHCSNLDPEFNTECKKAGGNGRPFPVYGPSGKGLCSCICSCVIAGTLIAVGDSEVAIEDLDVGALISQAGKENLVSIKQMYMSDLKTPHPMREILFEGASLTTTNDHPIVLANGKIVRAEDLQAGESLRDSQGEPVVVNEVKPVEYSGKTYNLIINPASEKALDHLIITNGVQSGDFLVQTTINTLEQDIDLRFEGIKTFSHLNE